MNIALHLQVSGLQRSGQEQVPQIPQEAPLLQPQPVSKEGQVQGQLPRQLP